MCGNFSTKEIPASFTGNAEAIHLHVFAACMLTSDRQSGLRYVYVCTCIHVCFIIIMAMFSAAILQTVYTRNNKNRQSCHLPHDL